MPLDLTTLIIGFLPGLLVGLGIGWTRFRNAGALETLQGERDSLLEQANSLRLEAAEARQAAAAARDQVRPLADELDRLKKEKAARKAVAPEAEAKGEDNVVAGWKPGRKLPTFMDAPIGPTDDLSMMKGVGPRLAARLREIGVFYFAQIADWSPEEVKLVDAKLDQFRGRIEKERMIEQAKLLAAGRITEYEARFGKLGAE
jgi:NADH-quinone oxidoreductase subunit E